jgi:hypothetical protein
MGFMLSLPPFKISSSGFKQGAHLPAPPLDAIQVLLLQTAELT